MLKPSALTHMISQANTAGVKGSLLLNSEGSLLAFSGPADRDARVTASIASNVWASYSKLGMRYRAPSPLAPLSPEDKLECVILNCKEGRVCVVPVAGLLLCLYCDTTVGFGMLKAKTLALAASLEQPLLQVALSG